MRQPVGDHRDDHAGNDAEQSQGAHRPMMGNASWPRDSASTTRPNRIGSASWTTATVTPAMATPMLWPRSTASIARARR